MTDYFQLYKVTALAAKSVDPRIRIGGPATAMSAWIPEFMAFCEDNNVPYDFISTHEYPTDPPGPTTRNFVSDVIRKTRSIVPSEIPLYYTEFNAGAQDALPYAAPFLAYQVARLNGFVDALSWWTFSDIFEENGFYPDPYTDGPMPYWGLMNVYGVPKPAFRAYQLLHWTGDTVLYSWPPVETYDTVSVFAIGGNGTSIFATNWNLPDNTTIVDETITVKITGVSSSQISRALMYRIDSKNAYAYPTWVQMGRPLYLTPAQVEVLNKASELVAESVAFTSIGGNSFSATLTVPANGLINIIIPS